MKYRLITDGYHIDKSYRVRIIDRNEQCIVDIPNITQQQLIQHVKELLTEYKITRRTDNIHSYDGKVIISKTNRLT